MPEIPDLAKPGLLDTGRVQARPLAALARLTDAAELADVWSGPSA